MKGSSLKKIVDHKILNDIFGAQLNFRPVRKYIEICRAPNGRLIYIWNAGLFKQYGILSTKNQNTEYAQNSNEMTAFNVRISNLKVSQDMNIEEHYSICIANIVQ